MHKLGSFFLIFNVAIFVDFINYFKDYSILRLCHVPSKIVFHSQFHILKTKNEANNKKILKKNYKYWKHLKKYYTRKIEQIQMIYWSLNKN